jgi:putative ABC transport system permease protein
MALGARPRDVLVNILKQGVHLGALGLALGLIASLGATRVLRSLFVNIDPVDPATLAFVGLGLGIVVLLASYVPALRATKVDPMVALRHE